MGLAREFVDGISRSIPVIAAVVVGSVARGDFNVWSDVDVVVVAEGLPYRTPDRGALLAQGAPGGVQPVGFTPEEFRSAVEGGNPLAREALERGEVLRGERFFRRMAAGRA